MTRALAIRRTEKNKMRSNWKSALRILAMVALTIGFLPSLPASANARGNGDATVSEQDPESHAQKAAPAKSQKAAPAAQKESEAEPSDAQEQEDQGDENIQAQM